MGRSIGFGVSPLFLASVLLLSCGQRPDGDLDYESAAVEAEQVITDIPSTHEPPDQSSLDARDATERKLVKTGSLSIEVEDVDAVAARVQTLVDSLGGYVAEERSADYGSARREFTLKIPAARFDAAVPRLEALPGRVTSRQLSVVDRTSEYVDVAARLQTQRALAARLRELVARADEVKEVIEVERELARVTGELERFEASLQHIDRSAAYATIELALYGAADSPIARSFLGEAGESLGFGVRFLRAAVLGILALWPLWVVVGIGVWWWRRRRISNESSRL